MRQDVTVRNFTSPDNAAKRYGTQLYYTLRQNHTRMRPDDTMRQDETLRNMTLHYMAT
jgi:hypothetical protein